MASTGGGKTSDEIVYDLAESILNKVPDILDLDKAEQSLFEVSSSQYTLLYGNTLKVEIFK